MTTDIARASAAAPDRFDAIEALLARYPSLDAAELADLRHWFKKEASAFEVASLASKDALAEPYARFRADHIDRFSLRDMAVGLAAFAFVVAAICAMIWLV